MCPTVPVFGSLLKAMVEHNEFTKRQDVQRNLAEAMDPINGFILADLNEVMRR